MPITLTEDEQIEAFYAQSYLAECNDVMARMYGFASADDIVGVRLDALLVRSDPDNLTFLRNFVRSGYHLVDAESHEVDKQGNTKIFLNTFVGIVENGLLVHTWGNQRDITERKQLEERLLQTQKMAAIGTLAGGIAHDFNNFLAAILGYTELAMDDMSPQNPQHGYLQEVLTAGKRARDLVQQILTFSRQTKHQRHPVHLHQLIKEALVMLRSSLPATITMQQCLDEQIGPVMVDTTQMHQVLMHLCTNAEYAMRETGGLLDVRLEAITLGPNAAALHPDLHPGRYLRITVHDSGHGITSEVQERIFEPFFTTKDVGEGTGMGLAVAHGIVANHCGVITVDSPPGQGTTFAVYLPHTSAAVLPSQQPAAPLLHGQGCVLLIDDEPPLVRIGHDMLVSLGYDVVACTSAQEALAVFRADADRFALVITDQTLPVMTGITLTHELRRTRSDIPIILCTGYSHVVNAETAAAQGIDAFLLKPITLYDLAQTVHQVLQQRSSLVE